MCWICCEIFWQITHVMSSENFSYFNLFMKLKVILYRLYSRSIFHFYVDVESLNNHKIWWNDSLHPNNFGPLIPYDGCPFICLGSELRECHHGPQRHNKTKVWRKEFFIIIWKHVKVIYNHDGVGNNNTFEWICCCHASRLQLH